MIKDKLVGKTIYFSLFVQIVTTLVSVDGLTYDLNDKDKILKDILILETIVQIVEAIFYVWVVAALKDIDLMTPRRYIDWFITTPTMLLSTIIFMEYLKNEKTFTFKEFMNENKVNITLIFISNALMLLFGYLGEIGKMNKINSVFAGFIPFMFSFYIIYENYASGTELGFKLYIFLLTVWSLYGFAALLGTKNKNISYNLLDIVAKNFYGLFIYFYIRHINGKNGLLGLM
jgi:bacteriorhodopsin